MRCFLTSFVVNNLVDGKLPDVIAEIDLGRVPAPFNIIVYISLGFQPGLDLSPRFLYAAG
jgi:hypothetical protein